MYNLEFWNRILAYSKMAAADSVIRKIGKAVKEVSKSRSSEWWYAPHMAAASRAISERIPLVDLLVEVRDARIPFTSAYEGAEKFPNSSKHVVVLNKMDLASPSHTKEWMQFFKERKCMSFGVNAHNRDNIKEFLTFLQARVRELQKKDTVTLMLVGIPNVGKSALANSLHQVGRISAEEKGKLKHSTVSPQPGETKSISSLKIGSHPNIYVLDTPGVLPPQMIDDRACSKLSLTGAVKDSVVGEKLIAEYCLSIICLSHEYKKWEKLLNTGTDVGISSLDNRKKGQYPTDHTQDFIVNNVRRNLLETCKSFTDGIRDEEDLSQVIKEVFKILLKVFHLHEESEGNYCRVASKLINLYRTGRLGHYTLDQVPSDNLI